MVFGWGLFLKNYNIDFVWFFVEFEWDFDELGTTWSTQNHQRPCFCYLKTRFLEVKTFVLDGFG